jgi:Rps23 Pro-64 3,4-dihydroxylase Tpa1-like proline 4-hydroxylase
MTSKQILDSFSETLMQDERILSAQERLLVVTLLQHAKAACGTNHETREAVRSVIASAVGETVAQRAFAVLGGNIVERILEDSTLSFGEITAGRTTEVLGPKDPQSPGKDPQTPSVVRDPQTPSVVREPQPPSRPLQDPGGPQSPGKDPQTPSVKRAPKDPQPPSKPFRDPQPPSKDPQTPSVTAPLRDPQTPSHSQTTTVVSRASVAVAQRPETLPAKCVVLDEFLAPQELEELTRFTLNQEASFQTSEVISPTEEHGIVNYEHRRSRVLMDLERHEGVILDRIKAALPQVLEQLGMEEFAIEAVEAQVTASNDGDFFHFHSDNSSEKARSRHLTFVYFFHGEPRQFEGGELRIHDARLEDGVYVSEGSYQTIIPQQNQIVFFPCELMHEITSVKCPSKFFADSRFTVNGWLRQ